MHARFPLSPNPSPRFFVFPHLISSASLSSPNPNPSSRIEALRQSQEGSLKAVLTPHDHARKLRLYIAMLLQNYNVKWTSMSEVQRPMRRMVGAPGVMWCALRVASPTPRGGSSLRGRRLAAARPREADRRREEGGQEAGRLRSAGGRPAEGGGRAGGVAGATHGRKVGQAGGERLGTDVINDFKLKY
jgi:hypothetical protein